MGLHLISCLHCLLLLRSPLPIPSITLIHHHQDRTNSRPQPASCPCREASAIGCSCLIGLLTKQIRAPCGPSHQPPFTHAHASSTSPEPICPGAASLGLLPAVGTLSSASSIRDPAPSLTILFHHSNGVCQTSFTLIPRSLRPCPDPQVNTRLPVFRTHSSLFTTSQLRHFRNVDPLYMFLRPQLLFLF